MNRVVGSAPELVELVRQRTDIQALIGQHVRLVASGADHKGPCPFHPDEGQSFHVSGRRQFYYCFECKASGDVFGFVMNYQNQSFWDAVGQLAGRAHVDLESVGCAADEDEHDQAQSGG